MSHMRKLSTNQTTYEEVIGDFKLLTTLNFTKNEKKRKKEVNKT